MRLRLSLLVADFILSVRNFKLNGDNSIPPVDRSIIFTFEISGNVANTRDPTTQHATDF